MIMLMGDTHAVWDKIFELDDYKLPDLKVIQLGDFGYFPSTLSNWKRTKFPVYFFGGNHDHWETIEKKESDNPGKNTIKVAPNLFLIRDGSVLELDGIRIGVVGGGCSVDKYTRLRLNWYWSPLEVVSDASVEALISAHKENPIDVLLTHAPPLSVIRAHFPNLDKKFWELPDDWEDISSAKIQYLWDSVGNVQLYCGHMHKSKIGSNYRILAIEELVTLPEKRK